MSSDPGKSDLVLRRVQLFIALAAATASLIVGAYNIRKIYFAKEKEVEQATQKADPIRSAVEEVGAEWIKELGKPKSAKTPQ